MKLINWNILYRYNHASSTLNNYKSHIHYTGSETQARAFARGVIARNCQDRTDLKANQYSVQVTAVVHKVYQATCLAFKPGDTTPHVVNMSAPTESEAKDMLRDHVILADYYTSTTTVVTVLTYN